MLGIDQTLLDLKFQTSFLQDMPLTIMNTSGICSMSVLLVKLEKQNTEPTMRVHVEFGNICKPTEITSKVIKCSTSELIACIS